MRTPTVDMNMQPSVHLLYGAQQSSKVCLHNSIKPQGYTQAVLMCSFHRDPLRLCSIYMQTVTETYLCLTEWGWRFVYALLYTTL